MAGAEEERGAMPLHCEAPTRQRSSPEVAAALQEAKDCEQWYERFRVRWTAMLLLLQLAVVVSAVLALRLFA